MKQCHNDAHYWIFVIFDMQLFPNSFIKAKPFNVSKITSPYLTAVVLLFIGTVHFTLETDGRRQKHITLSCFFKGAFSDVGMNHCGSIVHSFAIIGYFWPEYWLLEIANILTSANNNNQIFRQLSAFISSHKLF